ncbi:MAG: ammonia-forming cytochrome c nitrite reductase subunit c552 [Candidatus Hermodarchaeota archaeon]
MNNQEEKLIHKTRWNSRRFLLLYWFAFVFIGTAAAAGLGTSVLNPKLHLNEVDHSSLNLPSEWAPEDCMGSMCHNDTVASWNETGHSKAGKLLSNGSWLVGDDHIYNDTFFRSCYGGDEALIQCHTTRYNETDGTYWTGTDGVSCAACHEEPGTIDYAADSCQSCHEYSSNNITGDYQMSAHSGSYEDLLAGGYAPSYCMHCMTGQGMYMDVTGKEDFLTSINCGTCHDPHDATNTAQLREAEVIDLCGTCHTVEVFEDSSNKHLAYVDEGCVSCHGYQLDPKPWNPNNARINHTWEINFEDACGQCHTGQVDARKEMLENIHGDYETLNATYHTQVANVTAKVDEANGTAGVDLCTIEDAYALIEEAEELISLLEHDASRGFHNPTMMEDNFALALTKLNEAYAKAEAAIDGESPGTTSITGTTSTSSSSTSKAASTPGYQFFAVLVAISIVSTVLIYRKRR